MQPSFDRPASAPRSSPLAALWLFGPLALAVATSTPAAAAPLAAFGSHAGEDHSFEDHSGEDLHHIDLSEADLTETDLSAANLRSGVLVAATLVSARLVEAELEEADFSSADLTGADLSGAIAEAARFVDAILDGAVLVGADLENADFTGASLMGADLSTVANGESATFTGAYYDWTTQLDPAIDTSDMYYVTGACPDDPDLYYVDTDGDGSGDECHAPASLPEPGDGALLAAVALLAALARRARPQESRPHLRRA